MRAQTIGLLLFGASQLIVGCDSPSSTADERHFEAVAGHADARLTPASDWLDDASQAVPERWLVSRLAGAPVAPDDARVVAIGAQFDRLDTLFAESRRMLANRTLQIHRMLGEAGVQEAVVDTLEVVERAGGERAIGNFGQYTCYYVTLRRQGLSRQDAARTLWIRTPADNGSGDSPR